MTLRRPEYPFRLLPLVALPAHLHRRRPANSGNGISVVMSLIPVPSATRLFQFHPPLDKSQTLPYDPKPSAYVPMRHANVNVTICPRKSSSRGHNISADHMFLGLPLFRLYRPRAISY